MHPLKSCRLLWILVLLAAAVPISAAEVVLEKAISREHPLLGGTGRRLAIGQDGLVYIVSSEGFLLRMERDGAKKTGIKIASAAVNVGANTIGNIAIAHAHMVASVQVYDPSLKKIGTVRDFLTGDQLGWGAPNDLQVGASGDFYTVDQNRNRILRIAAPQRVATTYSMQGAGEDFARRSPRIRVNERLKRFYIATPGQQIHAISFAGEKLWTIQAEIGGESHPYDGEFDADDEGNVYVLVRNAEQILVFGPDGKLKDPILLQMSGRNGVYTSLEHWGDELFIKRVHETELFQVYDRKTGEFKRSVNIDMDQLKVEFPSAVWTAGKPTPVKLALRSPGKVTQPPWPVRIALYNDTAWIDLPVIDGKITPPTDAAGLYQVRVGHGDFKVDTVVQIRKPDSRGTVTLMTPLNRVYYGRGEELPIQVIARSTDAKLPTSISLQLRSRQAGASDVLRMNANEIQWKDHVGSAKLSPELTAQLRPDRYLLTATVDGFTVAPQPLVIGTGLRQRPVFNTIYGDDYNAGLTKGNTFEAPYEVANHAAWSRKMGINMYIERLGDFRHADFTATPNVAALMAELKADPQGVAPEKAELENVMKQTIAAHGASGIEEQAVLIYMDSSLPFDKPGLSSLQKSLETTTTQLRPYPAFRGWSWASNWWLERDVAKLTNNRLTKAHWDSLRETALKTGKWDPEIEQISDLWISLIPELDQSLNATLQKVAPGKIRALSGPYRQPAVIPSICLRNADEIDLYLQPEQVQPPYVPPHNVDFYRRDGKRTWGHAETFNDDGTGGMISASLLQMAMRGAEGSGYDGTTEIGWGTGKDSDPRTTGQGSISIHRAVNGLLRQYGPWLTTLKANDPLAIVVSTRMMRLDEWDKPMGSRYFARLFEAYMACHFAHRPATYVFTEDVSPERLRQFKAVLLVSQAVELDPPLADALAAAEKSGTPVFYDEMCRKELVSQFRPLHLAFNQVEDDDSWQDDAAYYRYPRYFKQHAAELKKTVGAIVPPVAGVDNPEIMLTERTNGEGRFVWALNNDLSDWEPGVMWRVAMFMANRVPQVTPIDLQSKGQTIYEVFAMQEAKDRTVADLRTMPARLFAVLPQPVQSVSLSVPKQVKAGDELSWKVAIAGPKMTYPLRLRLTDADGTLIEEVFPVATHGTITSPLNSGSTLTLEAMELISGKRAEQKIQVSSHVVVKNPSPAPSVPTLPVEKLFGPHLREIAVRADGSQALINAMSWEDNYYLVNTADGAVQAHGSVGHHFAYAPLANQRGMFVQGYDIGTAEGFHLYELSTAGKPERRFATYGRPLRGTKVFGGPKLPTPINNYVVAPSGNWIANAGNLGLVVWSKDGKKLWSHDWWRAKRQIMHLLALGEDTLVTLSGMQAAAYKVLTGEKLWEIELADMGTLHGGAASADGRTLAVFSDTEKGRVFVLRDGKLVNTFFVLPENVAIAPDGRHLATIVRRNSQRGSLASVGGCDLQWCSAEGGLEWVFQGDDWLHGMRIAPDGKKIAVCSDVGTLTILDEHGRKLLDRDYGSLPTAAWLPKGELLVATWMGYIARLNADGVEQWRFQLAASGKSRLQSPPVAQVLPTLNPVIGNSLPTPLPLTPNLLARPETNIRVTGSRSGGASYALKNPVALLTDGQPQSPAEPWLEWPVICLSDSAWTGGVAIEFEDLRSQLRVEGITFVEDPQHPESWLRDMQLQVWDPIDEAWIAGPYMVSNAATHSHRFEKLLIGSKFRLIGTGGPNWDANIGGVGWPVGNLRLGEIVFHGDAAGPLHPDAAANRPVAVLFDDNESVLRNFQGFKLVKDGAYSGDQFVSVNPGIAGPTDTPPLGATMPGWDFEIVENPTQPGQYRWLQFACKSLSKDTRGIALLLGHKWATDVYGVVLGAPNYAGLPDGRISGDTLAASQSVSSTVPGDWQIVRIDLWKAFAKPTRIRCLGLVSTGGEAAFDQILLGRTEADLPSNKPAQP